LLENTLVDSSLKTLYVPVWNFLRIKVLLGLEVRSLLTKGRERVNWDAYSVSPGAVHYVAQTKGKDYFFVSKKV
jgi:hypothetical protein